MRWTILATSGVRSYLGTSYCNVCQSFNRHTYVPRRLALAGVHFNRSISLIFLWLWTLNESKLQRIFGLPIVFGNFDNDDAMGAGKWAFGNNCLSPNVSHPIVDTSKLPDCYLSVPLRTALLAALTAPFDAARGGHLTPRSKGLSLSHRASPVGFAAEKWRYPQAAAVVGSGFPGSQPTELFGWDVGRGGGDLQHWTELERKTCPSPQRLGTCFHRQQQEIGWDRALVDIVGEEDSRQCHFCPFIRLRGVPLPSQPRNQAGKSRLLGWAPPPGNLIHCAKKRSSISQGKRF